MDKGADVELAGVSRAAEGGGAVAWTSFGSVSGAPARGYLNQVRSARGATGWISRGVTTPLDYFANAGFVHTLQAISPDAHAGLASGWGAQDAGHPQMINLWRWDADGPFELVSRPMIAISPDDPRAGSTYGNYFAGGSDDLRVVVFSSHKALTPEVPVQPGVELGGTYLYRWFGDQLSAVAVLPEAEGGTVVTGAVLGYGDPNGKSALGLYAGDYAVSADGSRVFFTTERDPASTGRELYLRSDDPRDAIPGLTTHVSASERTDCAGDPTCGGDDVPDPAADPDGTPTAAQFQLANSNGSQAIFASPRKLTDDATASGSGGIGPLGGNDSCAFERCDLYRWDATAPADHRLTDLTTADASGAGVLSTVGASRDATRVYFVAIGVLAAGAHEGEPNLYLWRQGEGVRYVATLDGSPLDPGSSGAQEAGDAGIWEHQLGFRSDLAPGFRQARVTADGRYLVFRSRLGLTGYDTVGHYQLYRFDSNTDVLECVSCNPRTDASTGDAYLKRNRASLDRPAWLSRNVSLDGRVVFDSAEALVASDTNNKIDVYEWADGEIRLISGGQSPEDSGFLDASASGDDLFFTTRQRLVTVDTDDLVDLYDARVDGGFPEPSPPSPECVGDMCQGESSGRPSLADPGSYVRRGPREVRADSADSFGLTKLSAAQGTALANGHAVALRVKVNRAGRLSAKMTARVAGKTRTVASATKVARKAGRVKLSLRLSKVARNRLAKTRTLKLRLSVTFAGVREPKIQLLSLDQPMTRKASRRHSSTQPTSAFVKANRTNR